MSGRNKGGRRDFTAVQFANCVRDGLNVHICDDEKNAAAKKKSNGVARKKKKTSASTKDGGDYSDPGDGDVASKPSGPQPQLAESKSLDAAKSATGATAGETAENATNSNFPRVECTNGAMEALRLSHSAFLETMAASLGELGKYSLTDKDVLSCLEGMGLPHLAERAMTSSPSGNVDSNHKQAKKRQKKKRAFAGFSGTQEELIAEQERLLKESAARVNMMNQKPEAK